VKLLAWLFRCRHKRMSKPITRNLRTYVVCLDCGSEFKYDWTNMKVVVD
jgi:hypothetical protein